MIKQTIKFKDLEGNDVEDDFFFHLNKAEVAKLFIYNDVDDPEEWVKTLMATRDGKVIVDTFENMIRMAYGVKSDNGRRFIKGDEAWLDFYESDAYSEFFIRIVTDATFAAEFMTGIMPADVQEQVGSDIAELVKPVEDVELPEKKDYSQLNEKEILALPREELIEAYRQRMQAKVRETSEQN